jgi:hypothetical protein
MAKHLPPYHSPLSSLGKKVLLWIIVPVVLLATGVYVTGGFDTTRPPTEAEKRSMEVAKERAAILRERYAPTLQHSEELKTSLAGKDDVATLQEHIKKIFELSGEVLEEEELRIVQGMTPEQLVEYKQKKLDGLKTDRQRGAYALWVQAEAQKKLAPAATVPPVVACTKPDDNLVPGRDAKLVRDGADYKIVLLNGVKMPKGSVVTGRDGTVIATAAADDTTEFSINAGNVQRTGKLSVKIDPAKPENAAYVHVLPTDLRCLQPKGL